MLGLAPLAACSRYRDIPTTPAPAAITRLSGCPHTAVVVAPDYEPAARAGSVPDGFQPTSVFRCTQVLTRTDEHRITLSQQTAPVTAALLNSVALPDQELANSRVVCSAVGETFLSLYLVDTRHRGIRVRLPRNPCGVRDEVRAAISDLSFGGSSRFSVEPGR